MNGPIHDMTEGSFLPDHKTGHLAGTVLLEIQAAQKDLPDLFRDFNLAPGGPPRPMS